MSDERTPIYDSVGTAPVDEPTTPTPTPDGDEQEKADAEDDGGE